MRRSRRSASAARSTSLRRELPDSMPLSGLSISAVGDHVVVREGEAQRQVDSGQYLLGLERELENGVLRVVEHQRAPQTPTAPRLRVGAAGARLVCAGAHLESTDPEGRSRRMAQRRGGGPAQRRGLDQPGTPAARAGQDAARRQRSIGARWNRRVRMRCCCSIRACCSKISASRARRSRLIRPRSQQDPELADCHYNLARLYESLGKPQHAIRHLGQYRRLLGSDGR